MSPNEQQQQHHCGTDGLKQSVSEARTLVIPGQDSRQPKRARKAVMRGNGQRHGNRQHQRPHPVASVKETQPVDPRPNFDPVPKADRPSKPDLPSVPGRRQLQSSPEAPGHVKERPQNEPPRGNAGAQRPERNQSQAPEGSVQAPPGEQLTSESAGPSRSEDNGSRESAEGSQRELGLVQQYWSLSEYRKGTFGPDVDIVAMHGLRARSPKTWEARTVENDEKSPTVNWLKDTHMLPAWVPDARILTYDWNADIVGGASNDRFLGHADMLLNHLIIDRESNKRSHCPIIFVASCFSGLLLAKALVRAAHGFHEENQKRNRLLELTVGVIFLGTPFRGSWESGYTNCCLLVDVAKQEGEVWSMELPQYLRPDSRRDGGGGPSPLNEVVQTFAEMVNANRFKIPMVCFYETQPSSCAALYNKLPEDKRPNTKGREVTVPQDSACLDGAHKIGLDVRHNMLHKHKSPHAFEFKQIASKIRDYAKGAHNTMAQKFKFRNEFQFAPASEIANSIKAAEFSRQQSHYLQLRDPKTCLWFLTSQEFRTWETEQQRTLFCPGVPGAGKTVLTSAVVDHLHSKYSKNKACKTALAYVYFSHERQTEQRCEEIISSILKQLLRQSEWPPEKVLSLYRNHEQQTVLPELEEISTALRATASKFRRVFVVIDALDECDENERDRLLHTLFCLREECQANLFFTARPLPSIQRRFGSCIRQVVRAQEEDISAYVRHQVSEAMYVVLRDSAELKEQIVRTVVKRADGMFILARLYMNLLKDQLRPRDVKSTLESFHRSGSEASRKDSSTKVADAYAATVDRINSKPKTYRKLAKQVFMWVTFARRPMSKAEITHALAIDRIGQSLFNEGDLYPDDHLITACQGLIDIEESSNIMRWCHPTAQEYFQQNISQVDPDTTLDLSRPDSGHQAIAFKYPDDAHRVMSLVCMTYLSLKKFDNMHLSQLVEASSQSDNMLGYAAVNWGRHAELAWTALQPREKRYLLDFAEGRKLAMAYRLFLDQEKKRHLCYFMQLSPDEQMDPVTLPLAIAVDLRLPQLVAELLMNGHDPNGRDQHGVPILSRAARIGDLEIAEMLVERGASPFPDLPTPSRRSMTERPTPLLEATKQGHCAVAGYLLGLLTIRGGETDEPMKKLRAEHAQGALSALSVYGLGKSDYVMLTIFRDAGIELGTDLEAKASRVRKSTSATDPGRNRTLSKNSCRNCGEKAARPTTKANLALSMSNARRFARSSTPR